MADSLSKVQYDVDLAKSVVFQLAPSQSRGTQPINIQFQFPPRVNSDNRGANWREVSMKAAEPIAIFADSTAREISLEWDYIVTGTDSGWTTSKIHQQIYTLRSYFGGVNEGGSIDKLIVKFKMWSIGGKDPLTFRLTNVSVKHSPTIVCPIPNSRPSDNTKVGIDYSKKKINTDLAYPLKTTVSVNMRSWTQKGGLGGVGSISGDSDSGAVGQSVSADDIKQAVSGLSNSPSLEWF